MLRATFWLTIHVLFFIVYPAYPQTWEQKHDFAGKHDTASRVFISGSFVAVAGTAMISSGYPDCVIRIYARNTGTILWTDQQAFAGTVCKIYVFQNSLYAVMDRAGDIPGLTHDIALRAYELNTGRLLWEQVINSGRDDRANALVANAQAVAVVGTGANQINDGLRGIVYVFTPNGQLLLSAINQIRFLDVALEGTTVIAVGGGESAYVPGPSGGWKELQRDWFVKTYELPNLGLLTQATREVVLPLVSR